MRSSRPWTWCAGSPSSTASSGRAPVRADAVGIQFPAGRIAGRCAQSQDALRSAVHEDGHGRSTVASIVPVRRLINQHPGRGGTLILSAAAVHSARVGVSRLFECAARRESRRQAVAVARHAGEHDAPLRLRGRRAQRGYPVLDRYGREPRNGSSRRSESARFSGSRSVSPSASFPTSARRSRRSSRRYP